MSQLNLQQSPHPSSRSQCPYLSGVNRTCSSPSLVEKASGEFERSLRLADILRGGMNGVTLRVKDGHSTRVLKWVPATEREMFQNGAKAAFHADRTGVISGAPIPAQSGALTVSAEAGEMMLMPFIEGTPLTDSAGDQSDMARVLLGLHAGTEVPAAGPFSLAEWVRTAETERLPAWVLSVAAEAVEEFDTLPATRWCTINGDPSPEEFRRTQRGLALLDWGSATVGPALYDVATMYMYLGGSARGRVFIDSYSAGEERAARELGNLPSFMRLRAAVQAVYFARRIAAGSTNIDREGDEEGIEAAREMVQQCRPA